MKNLKLNILTIGALTTLMFAYNNCSQSEFSENAILPSFTKSESLEDINDVVNDCANKTHKVIHKNIVFQAFQDTCKWETEGNLSKKDGYFRARQEQEAIFTLPNKSKLCNMEFDFPQQEVKYDDYFVFTFNDVVLASGYDFSDRFSYISNLPIYNWNNIVDSQFSSSDPEKNQGFCAGEKEGLSNCHWPFTDTDGDIFMKFDQSIFQRIMAFDKNNIQHKFKLISTGDNDHKDCEFSRIEFDIKVSYVE